MLRRALSRHRADRFPTIRAFARAFEAAASGVSPDAAPTRRPPTPPRLPAVEGAEQQRPRRRRGLGTRIAITVALAISILGGAGWLLRAEPPIATWLQQARAVLDRH